MDKTVEVKHYKVRALPTKPKPNSIYYVLEQITGKVKTYITDMNGFPIALIDEGVLTVTGTGVTGSSLHPKIDIATFVSEQIGNQVYLSILDGKLQVNPLVSPDLSLDILSTSTELQIQLSADIQNQINISLKPGDNISELFNDISYATESYVDSKIPVSYSKIVYVNTISPTTATIFDLNNPPVVNDNSLKTDVNNLYIGTDASTWVYITSPAGYITKAITSGTSNFYLGGTSIDAGGDKTTAIERAGTVGGAPGTASNHFVTKAQLDLKENVSNKTDDIEANKTSSILYTSAKSIVTWLLNYLFTNSPAKAISLGDTDLILLGDSVDSFKSKTKTFAQIKDTLKTYFEGIFQIKDNQVEISNSGNVQNSWHGQTILFTSNCTITVPAVLNSSLMFPFRTLAGVTVTWAITSPFVWETTPVDTPEKTVGHFMRRGSTNTIFLDT